MAGGQLGRGRAICGQLVGDQAQLGCMMPHDEFPLAIIAAHLGRIDEARTRSQDACPADAAGSGSRSRGTSGCSASSELSLGDAMAAPAPATVRLATRSCTNRGCVSVSATLLEALVATGDSKRATPSSDVGGPGGSARPRLGSRHSRPLSRAAAGGAWRPRRRPRVLRALDRRAARDVDPFSRARTLLAQGTQRRCGSNAAPPGRPSRAHWPNSSVSAHRSGRSRLAAEPPVCIAPRCATSSPRPSGGSQPSSPKATNREVARPHLRTEALGRDALTRIYRKLGVPRLRGCAPARANTGGSPLARAP